MKYRKKISPFLVAVLMMVLCMNNIMPSNNVYASGNPTIEVSSASAKAGEEVTLDIVVKNNPGIIGMQMELLYDQESLKIVEAKNMQLFDIGTISKKPSTYPFILMWEAKDLETNMTGNGVVAQVTFLVNASVGSGVYDVKVRYDEVDIFNADFENVAFDTTDGAIEVVGKGTENVSEQDDSPKDKPVSSKDKAVSDVKLETDSHTSDTINNEVSNAETSDEDQSNSKIWIPMVVIVIVIIIAGVTKKTKNNNRNVEQGDVK